MPMQPQPSPLPDDVKHLVVRKLRKLRREFDFRLVEAKTGALASTETDIGPALRDRKVGNAMTKLPLLAYRALAAKTIADIQGLPLAVWEATKATIESARLEAPVSRSELIGLLDDFTWRANEEIFALQFLDATRFVAAVHRSFRRRGLNDKQMLDRLKESILHQHALATVGINDFARRGREAAEIAIDDYLLSRAAQWKAELSSGTETGLRGSAKQSGRSVPKPGSAWFSAQGRKAANARHDLPGGARERQRQVLAMWATGKYRTKERCAEAASDALGMSFSTARKALRTSRKQPK